MQFMFLLLTAVILQLGATSSPTESPPDESGQCASREEFRALREQLARSREETAAVRREVDSWQNSTILILKRYLIENPNDLKVELQQVKDELQQIKQRLREEHVTTRNTSLEATEGCVSLVTENIQNLINIAHNNTLEELKQSVFQCQPTVGSRQNPAASCKDIAQSVTPSASGYYWIGNSSVHARRTYCDMTRRCCNSTGGWMRVANFDMTKPSQNCPQGFRTISSPRRMCGRQNTGCVSVTFSTYRTQYSKVCGKVIGYQYKSPDAFDRYSNNPSLTIDSNYIDGVSLTHGRSPRKHIWSFVGSHDEDNAHMILNCPCTRSDLPYPGRVPPFIQGEYFCETAARNHLSSGRPIFNTSDPLWDGSGCGTHSTCCSLNSPPWFCKQLPQSTTDDIELRLCGDEVVSNEDTPIELVEVYVY